MDFSKEVARKYLKAHMFNSVSPAKKQTEMIDTVLKGLSSVGIFKVHGRMINGIAAKDDLHLKVKLLGKNDDFWKDLWQYYVRADVLLSRSHGMGKLIKTKDEILIMGRMSE